MPVLFSEFCGAANFSIIFWNNSCVRFWFFIRTYEESAMQSHSADFLEACQSRNFELTKVVRCWSGLLIALNLADFWFSNIKDASKGWRRESQRNCHILVSDLANSPWCASVFCFSQVTVQRTWKATSWTLPNASCLQLKPLVRVKYTLSTWVWAVSPSLYKHCCQTTKTTTSKEISLAVNYAPVTAPRFRSVIAVVISNACKKTSICSTG